MDQAILQATAVIEAAAAGTATRPEVVSLFDSATASVTHILHDGAGHAVVIDPVLDFDAASGRVGYHSAQAVLAQLDRLHLRVELILETHVHADHLSAAAWLNDRLGAPIATGCRVGEVQRHFGDVFGAAQIDPAFDRLLDDGETFRVGALECMALHVPGHTPADTAYVVGDAVVTGDTIFMPDLGTARADFPGGDAAALHASARRLLSLPGVTRLLHCHDYPPAPRGAPGWTSTVAEQRAANIHVRDGVSQADFVALRTARDATLSMPALMLPSVQVNMRGGALPAAASNGRRYLQLPIDAF